MVLDFWRIKWKITEITCFLRIYVPFSVFLCQKSYHIQCSSRYVHCACLYVATVHGTVQNAVLNTKIMGFVIDLGEPANPLFLRLYHLFTINFSCKKCLVIVLIEIRRLSMVSWSTRIRNDSKCLELGGDRWVRGGCWGEGQVWCKGSRGQGSERWSHPGIDHQNMLNRQLSSRYVD